MIFVLLRGQPLAAGPKLDLGSPDLITITLLALEMRLVRLAQRTIRATTINLDARVVEDNVVLECVSQCRS